MATKKTEENSSGGENTIKIEIVQPTATKKTSTSSSTKTTKKTKSAIEKVYDKNKDKITEGIFSLVATALIAVGSEVVGGVKKKMEVNKVIKDLKNQVEDIAANPRTMTETKIQRVRKELDAVLNRACNWKQKKTIMELQDKTEDLLNQLKGEKSKEGN